MCTFKPVSGQGMSVAALDDCPRQYGPSSARAFHRRAVRIVALPWAMATSEDARYPGADGATRDVKTRLLHDYMARQSC